MPHVGEEEMESLAWLEGKSERSGRVRNTPETVFHPRFVRGKALVRNHTQDGIQIRNLN